MLRAIGEIALRLDHEEARRHADLEALLLGVEPLLGELAPEPRRLDPLPVLLELRGRVADLADGRQLEAAQPGVRLVALEPRPGERCLLGALAERIAEA